MTAYFDMDEAQFDRLMRTADFGTMLVLITGETSSKDSWQPTIVGTWWN